MKWKNGIVAAVVLLAAAGCGTPLQNKTPDELLSLSVSGLAAIDRYAFSGITGIAAGEGIVIKPVPFKGTVENHNRIRIKSNGEQAGSIDFHPLELLKQVEGSAGKTELVASESGDRTAVLQVKANGAKAAELWKKKLRGEFADVRKQSSEAAGSDKAGSKRIVRSAASEAAYIRARDEELNRSQRELDHMLSTLQVDTTYRVVVDRSRLIPLKLEEATVLHYTTAAGDKRREQRKMSIDFKPLQQ